MTDKKLKREVKSTAKKKAGKSTSKNTKTNWNTAKSDDGTIQITFTIPFANIKASRSKALAKIGENLTVPGFRKGKAPEGEVLKHASRDNVIQETLSTIVPDLFAEVIKKDNLKPAIYPKFELLKSIDNEPWEVRAITCELPEVKLGDYKKKVKAEAKGQIWTPGSDEKKEEEVPESQKQAEKERMAIGLLFKEIKVKIPSVLIEEETNNKVSQLLERIEKLGLDLDSYLKSTNKTPQVLRAEYEKQAIESLSLDLILNKIAEEEKISVEKEELDASIKATSSDPEFAKQIENNPQQIRLIESVLIRRKALQSVIDLL